MKVEMSEKAVTYYRRHELTVGILYFSSVDQASTNPSDRSYYCLCCDDGVVTLEDRPIFHKTSSALLLDRTFRKHLPDEKIILSNE